VTGDVPAQAVVHAVQATQAGPAIRKAVCLVELVRPVADLERACAFYRDALGFVADAAREHAPEHALEHALVQALAEAWGHTPRGLARLRLGGQTLLLAACAGTRKLPDGGAEDPRFQHIAIVTPDIDAAWARVRAVAPSLRSITHGGPVQLPAASGGVSACKFRDPDGHPVELIAFAPGHVPPRWQTAAGAATALPASRMPARVPALMPALVPAPTPALTQGIDHSAITVADAGRSVDFYRGLLGLAETARQTNRGLEQALLDGLPAPVVDVVGLAAGDAPPHLELLGYHRSGPAGHPGLDWRDPDRGSGPRTCTVWAVADADTGADASTPPSVRIVHDPDGHTLLLLSPAPAPTT
jgi:catechol 2,3-dioxygenase-like lactoylglutathione lyase family enzyme